MSDQWQYYPCTIGDDHAFIFLDVGIQKSIDENAPSFLVQIALKYLDPHPSGLPKKYEFSAVSSVEDTLTSFVMQSEDWYVGRVTVAGHRHFYIYSNRTEAEWITFTSSLRKQTGYEMALSFLDDPDHKGYWKELYPTSDDWQVIKDLRVIENLEKHDDDGSERRKVDHWLYFSDKKALKSFEDWLTKSRFQNEPDLSSVTEDGRFCLRASHYGTIKIADISSHTIELRRKAEELGGDYDGWETAIMNKA